MNLKLLAGAGVPLLILAGCATANTANHQPMPTTSVVQSQTVAEPTPTVTESTSGVTLAQYNKADFDQAIADGKTVFVDFHADWCSTCAANKPNIDAALQASQDDNLVAFIADYDTESELKKQFEILMQSTLVVIPNGDITANIKLGPGLLSEDDISTFIQT